MTHRPFCQFVISALALCGCIVATLVIGQDQPKEEKKRGATAAEVMKRAHGMRAEWKDFSGFKADVVVSADSNHIDGTVEVSADGDVALQLADSELAEWAKEDLKSLVDHRLPGGSREYDVEFLKGERPNAQGRLIRFNDDRMHSVYRVRYNLITEVHRTMGNRKLMINVVDVQWNQEKKVLPRTYTVSWTDVKTDEVSSMQVVNNRWARVGMFDLPARVLKIINKEDGGREVREIRLENHELLTTK
jgi:hypothetical protein